MMRRSKRLAKTALFGVRRDEVSGHLYYLADGKRLYIRSADECVRPKHRQFIFESLLFRHYMPAGSDCVIDFGAGNGTEIVPVALRSPDLKYIAVEIQPWVYECLCLTLAQFGGNYRPFALAVGDAREVRLSPTVAGTDVSILGGGTVPVEGIGWADFVRRLEIDQVDLLKVNIEGAEADLLEHIDLGMVRRIILSVHDFRADRGEGEHFRTRAKVQATLEAAGFVSKPNPQMAEDWMRSWMYWERP
ncbi:MAG: FkbM family methyltransferase [Allosphingosinicella sp.]